MFALSHRLDDKDNVATALHGRRSFLFLHVVTLRSGNSLFQDVRGESGSTDKEPLLRTKQKQKEETEVRMKMKEREREREREGSRVGDVEITFNPVSPNPLYLTEIRQHSKPPSPSSAVKQKTWLTFTSLPLHSPSDCLPLIIRSLHGFCHSRAGLRNATPSHSQYP